MDSLLHCDEDWLFTTPTTTPTPTIPLSLHREFNLERETPAGYSFYFYTTTEDHHNALLLSLEKEMTYMPDLGYLQHLKSLDVVTARVNAIKWFIKSQRRLNLSLTTVFYAVNYFDRFVSMEYSKKWKYWMIELLSIACLSIAAKFTEVSIPPLHDLQMEDLDHSFQENTIQRMELTVLKVLDWRINCVTTHSYVDLLTWHLNSLQPLLHEAITSRLNELLLGSLSDPIFLEFRPCIVTLSALKCCLEELLPSKADAHISNISSFVPQVQRADIEKCHKMMEERVADPSYSSTSSMACGCGRHTYCPSSPTTVLTKKQIDTSECYVHDLCIFRMSGSNINFQRNGKKRKIEDYDDPISSSQQ
ncbi:PREDICTED: putative cyclin-D7-1 [Nelumbo nucifera]|uniref:Cyclin-D7-1 n=1 Tax=Nelumbo nucifera TaxID=4432 RepID=A0A1U7ZRI0_NELNU|nr:PREDICTED: putative cyclin-D7-1 [Nelumbo nucifera]